MSFRAALLGFWLAPSVALAQGYDPSWAIELYNSPVIAPASVMGRGGATLALTDGVGAMVFQPAAVASRLPHNGNEWFDWDWSVDFMTVGFAANADVENSGRPKSDADSIELLNVSLGLVFGRLGVGQTLGAKTFTMCVDPAASTCEEAGTMVYSSVLSTTALGYNFFDGQLVVGVEATTPNAAFELGGEAADNKFVGTGFGLGVIARPLDLPLRVGLSARGPITSRRSDAGDGELIGGRLLPDRLAVPWQVGLGVAYGLDGRPLNLRGSFGDEALIGESVVAGSRAYTVVLLDLLLVGPTHRAVGGAGWLAQQLDRAGETLSFSPRLGFESELSDNFFRGRVGTYYEPSRFTAGEGRLHATGGFDLHAFELIWEWRLTGAVDAARAFFNLSLSLGFWH